MGRSVLLVVVADEDLFLPTADWLGHGETADGHADKWGLGAKALLWSRSMELAADGWQTRDETRLPPDVLTVSCQGVRGRSRLPKHAVSIRQGHWDTGLPVETSHGSVVSVPSKATTCNCRPVTLNIFNTCTSGTDSFLISRHVYVVQP